MAGGQCDQTNQLSWWAPRDAIRKWPRHPLVTVPI